MPMLAERLTRRVPVLRYVVAIAPLALGCGQGVGSEPLDVQQGAVIGGQPSPKEQDAVVAILYGSGQWCTGTLVAPTLVMTARQCLFSSTQLGSLNLICSPLTGGAAIEQVNDATRYTVAVGNKHPLSEGARGKRIFAGPELDFCRNSVALLELDGPLTEVDGQEIAPLPLRLDALPAQGETGLLVGWGYTEQGINRNSEHLGDERWQTSLRVEAVGPFDFPIPPSGTLSVLGSWFLTGQGGCFGDVGAPFISAETGAVIGVMAALEPKNLTSDQLDTSIFNSCIGAHTAFRDLVSQRDWMRAAFADAGQTPWLEGFARPGEVGAKCKADGECVSGLCARTEGESFCSDHCDVRACPQNMQCLGAEGGKLCMPIRVATGDSTSSGCSMAPSCPARGFWQGLLFLALACLRVRRTHRFLVSTASFGNEEHS